MATCIYEGCDRDAELNSLYCAFHALKVPGKLLAQFVWDEAHLGEMPPKSMLRGQLLGEPGEYVIEFCTSADELFAGPLHVTIGDDGAEDVKLKVKRSLGKSMGGRGTVHVYARIRPEAREAWTKGAIVDVRIKPG